MTPERIEQLKSEKDVVMLVHNYQRPEIQDVADFLGDSLNLAMEATKVSQSTILFCGVDFMAESAKILNPEKTVLHPNTEAKCPMAAMIDIDGLRKLKEEHPEAVVVAYVNTTAETKTLTDICCTSANAVNVVKQLSAGEIIFIPDANLGLYVQRFIPDKKFIFWPGYCHVHRDVTPEDVQSMKDSHSNAKVLVHPECAPPVIDMADEVLSTEGMVRFSKSSDFSEFIIVTERELSYRLQKENPGKTFHILERAICPAMKKITMDDVLKCLESGRPEIELPESVIEQAKLPLERMLTISRGEKLKDKL
ncbi:MAG: quinolinate synthase NadA [Thermoplasmata archaeon]|nr:MAG: quinolinate synthase NadA [Thermoplasmata archaeon]